MILWAPSGAPPAPRTPRDTARTTAGPLLLSNCSHAKVPLALKVQGWALRSQCLGRVSDLAQLLAALHRTCSAQEIQRLRAVPWLGPEISLSPCTDCSNKFTMAAAENWLTNDSVCHDLSGPPGTCLQTQITVLPQVSTFLYFIFSSLSLASSAHSTVRVLALPSSPDHCIAHMSMTGILYFSLFPSEDCLPKMVLFSCRVS